MRSMVKVGYALPPRPDAEESEAARAYDGGAELVTLDTLQLRPMTLALREGSEVSIVPEYLPSTDEVAFNVQGAIDLPLPQGTVRISGENRVVMPRETFLHAQAYVLDEGRIPRLSAFLAQVYGRRPLLTR